MPLRNPTLQRLRRHRVPAWWLDAKLGIFIHWTIASVPAFAPVGTDFSSLLQSEQRDAYSLSPYVEWYQNSLRFPNSPVARHHRETYGDRPYESFRDVWEAGLEQWDPHAWAAQFKASGARYVVFVAKHADGYCLWPTDVANPRRPGWHCRRDVVGELADAVRAAGTAVRPLLQRRHGLDLQPTPGGVHVRRPGLDPPGRLPRLRRRAGPRADRPLSPERAVERRRLAGAGAGPLVALRPLLPAGPRRGGQRPVAALEPAAGDEPQRGGPPGDRRGRRPPDEPRRRPGATGPAPLRRADPRVRRLSRGAADAVGVRARDGRELRLQRVLRARGLHRPRRSPVAVDRHRGEGREPAAQRRPTRRRRPDPKRADGPAPVARRMGAPESRGAGRDPPLGDGRHDRGRRPPDPLHRRR